MSVDNLLFPEMELKAGDCINGKGKRLYSKDIYEGLIFVQQHSNIFLICRCEKICGQVIYSSGGYDKNYTRKEYIDYEGRGFESTLWYEVPESFKKIGVEADLL